MNKRGFLTFGEHRLVFPHFWRPVCHRFFASARDTILQKKRWHSPTVWRWIVRRCACAGSDQSPTLFTDSLDHSLRSTLTKLKSVFSVQYVFFSQVRHACCSLNLFCSGQMG